MPGSGWARSSHEKINKKKLERAVHHFSLGCSFESRGNRDGAVGEYREALREDPQEPYWHLALGDALKRQGNLQEALEAYSHASQLSPDDAGLRSSLEELQNRMSGGSGTTQGASKSPDRGKPPLEVGGKVTPPVPIYSPDPHYSEKARILKYQGTVILMLIVDSNGEVVDARDVKPLGLGLDENAIATVRTWKFNPATRDGAPVKVHVNVEVTFRMI
jgi:TonB family protein